MSTASNLLDRVLEPFTECLTPEVAQRIADMRAEPEIQSRLDVLANKANEGALSDEERREYDEYLSAFHLITILQAKARNHLKQQTGK